MALKTPFLCTPLSKDFTPWSNDFTPLHGDFTPWHGDFTPLPTECIKMVLFVTNHKTTINTQSFNKIILKVIFKNEF